MIRTYKIKIKKRGDVLEEKLRLLADRLIFKFQTPSEDSIGEMGVLLKDMSLEDFKEFILELHSKKYITFPIKFKKFKRSTDFDLPALLDWDKVYGDGLLKDTNVMGFMNENPKAFETTVKKSRYLADMASMGYEEVSLSINSLDQLIMTYFTSLTKYEQMFEGQYMPKIEDIYANMRFFIAISGLDDRGTFRIDNYVDLFKDFDIEIDDNLVEALKLKAEQTILGNAENINHLGQTMRLKRN